MHADAGKVHDYLKEQWAMDAARAAGVPTPRVLEVASLADGRPYMIMARVEDVEARALADRMAPLREMGLFAVRAAGRWRQPPVLHHGDLRLKNLIVDPDDGAIRALIDWENCVSSPPPYWDLSIALHELGIDEKEAFLEGYGITPAQFAKAAPFVRLLNVLNYAHAVHSAAETKNTERLAWLRLRLSAGLDLYTA